MIREYDLTITIERDGIRKELYGWTEGISKEQVKANEAQDWADLLTSEESAPWIVEIAVTP